MVKDELVVAIKGLFDKIPLRYGYGGTLFDHCLGGGMCRVSLPFMGPYNKKMVFYISKLSGFNTYPLTGEYWAFSDCGNALWPFGYDASKDVDAILARTGQRCRGVSAYRSGNDFGELKLIVLIGRRPVAFRDGVRRFVRSMFYAQRYGLSKDSALAL